MSKPEGSPRMLSAYYMLVIAALSGLMQPNLLGNRLCAVDLQPEMFLCLKGNSCARGHGLLYGLQLMIYSV